MESSSSTSTKAPSSLNTRAAATRPLIGHSRPDIPPRRLPTSECVLRVLAHGRQQPGCQRKGPLSFCCSLTKEHQAKCLLPGGCGEREDPCLQLRVSLPYRQAGIITISDSSIQKRIVTLNDEYSKIFMKRNVETAQAKAKREQFLIDIKKTFNITDPNARIAIQNDPVRSERAIQEDLAFFDDNFGEAAPRKWVMAGRDVGYDQELLTSLLSVEAKENRRKERERKIQERREREEMEKNERTKKVPEDDENSNQENDENQDCDDDNWGEDVKEKEVKQKGYRKQKRKRSKGDDGDGGSDSDHMGAYFFILQFLKRSSKSGFC